MNGFMGREIDRDAIADGRLVVLQRITYAAWVNRALDDAMQQGVSPPLFPEEYPWRMRGG